MNLGSVQLISKTPESEQRTKPLGQRVFLILREAIVRGEISPETRLTENLLADAFNISRTPVREALHKLEREGLIEKLSQGGFSISNLTHDEIAEAFDITGMLESYAARLASTRGQDADFLVLEDTNKEFQDSLDQGKLGDLPNIKRKFHSHLYSMSNSRRLIRIIKQYGDQMYLVRRAILRTEHLARICLEDQKGIVEAIKARNLDQVELAVRKHIMRGKEFILSSLNDDTGIRVLTDSSYSFCKRKIRVLLAKVGLDCHDRGVKIVARALQDAGMEVFYTGLYTSIADAISRGIEKDVEVLGFSIMSTSITVITTELKDAMKGKDLRNLLIIAGGLLSGKGIRELKEIGVNHSFPAGTPLDEVIEYIHSLAPFKIMGKEIA